MISYCACLIYARFSTYGSITEGAQEQNNMTVIHFKPIHNEAYHTQTYDMVLKNEKNSLFFSVIIEEKTGRAVIFCHSVTREKPNVLPRLAGDHGSA